MGKPHPNVAMNFAGMNFNDQHVNGYHVNNQRLHGNFPPPPPPLYNHGEPYLIVGDMQGHPKVKVSPQIQDLDMDRNEDIYSMHNSDISVHGDC